MKNGELIELLLAPAAAGKTRALLRRLRATRGPALLLVPGDEQRRALRRQVQTNPNRPQVLTFFDLAGLVLDAAGGTPPLLGELARRTLVRHLLAELASGGQLPTYRLVATKPGFVAAVAELFDDLGSAMISGERFAAAARTTHDAELALVYQRYQAFQAQHGLASLTRRLHLAQQALEHNPQLLANYQLLAVDGFDQFTTLQLGLLAGVAAHLPQVVLTLTAEPRPRPAQRRFSRTLAALRATFATNEHWLPAQAASQSPAALRQVAAHLFDLDNLPAPLDAGGAVQLIEAADREREVRAVLRRVARLLAEGAAPTSIAILYRDGTRYSALLREVAAEYRLPLRVAEGLPLAEHPAIIARLAAMGDQRPRTEDGRPATEDGRPATEDGRPATENGRSSPPANDPPSTVHRPPSASPHPALERFASLERQIAQAAALLGTAPLTPRAMLAELEAAVATARYQPVVAYPAVQAMAVLAARGRQFAHVALLGLSEGEFPQPLPEPAIYRRSERRNLMARGLPLTAPDPADERSLFYEAVTRARQSLILARTRLDETGNPLRRSPYLSELLELLAGVAVESVRAGSVPTWDAAASPIERALALAELLTTEGAGRKTEDGRPQTADRRPSTPAAERPSTVHHPPSAPPGDLSAKITALQAEYPVWHQIVRARQIEVQREGIGSYGPYEGLLSDRAVVAAVAAHFGPEYEWSISELNDYLTCPFRFAAGHLLKLEPRSTPSAFLDTAQRGQIYHAVLARAAANWQRAGLELTPAGAEAAVTMLEQASAQVLAAAPERFGFVPSAYWRWEQNELRRRLRAAVATFLAGGNWAAYTPVALEQGFGGESASPPLQLATPRGTARVKGRIDRIDQAADGSLAVIDYKSSATPRPRSETLSGQDVQMPLYALAIEQGLVAGRGPVTQAAFYHLGSGQQSTLAGEALRTTMAQAGARVGQVIEQIQAGDFRVRPHTNCPTYCQFEPICRRNLEKREHQPPALEGMQQSGEE